MMLEVLGMVKWAVLKHKGNKMKLNRRKLLQQGMLLGGVIGSGKWLEKSAQGHSQGNECQWEREYTFGHTKLFMEEYYQGTLDILGAQSGELDQIGDLTSRAAKLIKAGGTVWASMDLGHMPHYELKEERRGNPGIMKSHATNLRAERDFDHLKKGDIVFTHRANKGALAARERGVYVVCVTSNYWHNEFRPAGYGADDHWNPDGLMLGDVANEILHSHVPYEQGLVHVPQVPEFAVLPSSTTGTSIYWMLNAEIANKLANENAKEVDKSAQYLQILTERVQRLKEQYNQIRETAVIMAKKIRQGGRWFVKSIEHPGFESEFHVAQGIAVVNFGDWDASKKKNIMLITGISPAYPAEVKLALQKQIDGAYVIGIGPSSMDSKVPHGRLIDIADAGFDNLSPESGGVISVPGRTQTICPTSGIVGNVIQQMIVAQWADEMVRRGSVPYFLMGVYRKGGRAYNAAMRPFFELQGF